jgi:hypothetical protein
MRIALLNLTVASLLLGAMPAMAQDATIFDQYADVVATLGGTNADPADYRRQLLDGLAGDWFPIGALQPTGDDPDLFAMACEKSLTQIAVRDGFSFEASRVNAEGKPVSTTIYTARAGSEFGSYTDPQVAAKWLGIDVDNADATALNALLSGLNGTVSVSRPSPDILVIQKPGTADILARCAS